MSDPKRYEIKRFKDRAEWLESCHRSIATLKALPREAFFFGTPGDYHPVRDEIAHLVWNIKCTDFAKLLARHKLDRQLPIKAVAIGAMQTDEISFRLRCNISDERWAWGMLVAPFEAGTLQIALERLAADFAQLSLIEDEPAKD